MKKTLKIGKVTVPFLIDFGATYNIINNSEIWNKLNPKNVREIRADKTVFAFSSYKPSQRKGKLMLILCVKNQMKAWELISW